MIPVRLQLKNFMSYGENVEALDFRGMHVACLSGDNGNGKSALLDAITWTLWGEARASADELIRLGADEMRVIFEFELSGDLYRVIRGRSRKSSGNVWEVYVGDGAGNFRPITGQGMRDTERVIRRLLRMDYKTFINSAYIQQGRADEFTKQTVTDRKKILADILDLSRYDLLEQKSKDRRNAADQRIQELERDIAHVEAELSGEAGQREQLERCKAERDAIEERIAGVEKRLAELRARHAELDAQRRQVVEIDRQIQSLRAECTNLVTRKIEHEARVARSHRIVADKERILDGYGKMIAARERVTMLDRRMEDFHSLEREKSSLDQRIVEARHKLELDRQAASRELGELQARVEGAERVQKEIQSLTAQVQELDKLDLRMSELQESVARHSDRLGTLKAQYEAAVKSRDELNEKMQMISEPGARCPLCRTELGHDKHHDVIAEYKRLIAEAAAQAVETKRLGVESKTARDAAQKEIAEIGVRQREGMAVRDRLAQARQVLLQIEESRKDIPGAQTRLSSVTERIESGRFAEEIRLRLTEIAGKITVLQYNAEEHRNLRAELSSLQTFDSLNAGLKLAEESLPGDESSLKAIVELIAAREGSITDHELRKAQLSEAVKEFGAVASELNTASAELQGLRDSDRVVTGRIATLDQALTRCEALRAHVADQRVDLDKSRRDKAIYTDLVAAFGKKGVQALIIENAIPEIQEEANRLLARMTDNAMAVSIETVRDKKTGGVAETLDIRISDDMGTRSYELFSGGEAFRVNFALRIALSKLLARRAGARLQTLIIDEGFGTQDGKGREKLVDAIGSIQDDFDLVLVITHIEEMKDAFPTRIDVTKDSGGSQFSIT